MFDDREEPEIVVQRLVVRALEAMNRMGIGLDTLTRSGWSYSGECHLAKNPVVQFTLHINNVDLSGRRIFRNPDALDPWPHSVVTKHRNDIFISRIEGAKPKDEEQFELTLVLDQSREAGLTAYLTLSLNNGNCDLSQLS